MTIGPTIENRRQLVEEARELRAAWGLFRGENDGRRLFSSVERDLLRVAYRRRIALLIQGELESE